MFEVQRKPFFGSPSKGEPAKNLGTISEKLTICPVTWARSERLIFIIDKNDTMDEDTNI